MEPEANPLGENRVVSVPPGSWSHFSVGISCRLLCFAVLTLFLGLAFRQALVALVRLSLTDETYSYMPLIPLVSGYLFFIRRQLILSVAENALLWGTLVVGGGIIIYVFGFPFEEATAHRDQLTRMALAALLIWFGGFIGLFGLKSFRKASFPLLFLLFMVPFPSLVLQGIVEFLQAASTEVAATLFQLTGLPVLRDGIRFELPGLSVVVAEQCSGIRSSLSLFIISFLAAYFGLCSPWRRGLLILSILPITIFKNALRIITLSLLGAYVDKRILDTVVHRAGGIPFFALALIFLGTVLWLLRHSDAKSATE